MNVLNRGTVLAAAERQPSRTGTGPGSSGQTWRERAAAAARPAPVPFVAALLVEPADGFFNAASRITAYRRGCRRPLRDPLGEARPRRRCRRVHAHCHGVAVAGVPHVPHDMGAREVHEHTVRREVLEHVVLLHFLPEQRDAAAGRGSGWCPR